MPHTSATAGDVQDIMETSLNVSEIQPFLAAAQRFVADELENEGVSDATLTEIEKYMAAGIAASARDPGVTQESVGDVSVTYQRSEDHQEHMKVAAALDPTGKVEARFLSGSEVSFRVGAGYDDDLDLAVTG